MSAMCKVGLGLLAVAVLSLSCQEESHEPPPSTPMTCRDVPRLYDVDGYVQLGCSWIAATFTWSCTGGRKGPNWAVNEEALAHYLSEADVVAERTLGVVRAVTSMYSWHSSKGGGITETGQYTYDGQRRLVMKTVNYREELSPSQPLVQDEVYTFSNWDEHGRPLAGAYTSKWTDHTGAEPIPKCSDTFTLSYDAAAGRITRTADAQGCRGLAFSLSAAEFSVHMLGEKLLFSPRTVTVHETQHFCVPE